jgi:hypothetical protein
LSDLRNLKFTVSQNPPYSKDIDFSSERQIISSLIEIDL